MHPWLTNLINIDILQGTPEAFHINTEFEEEIRSFLTANSDIINEVTAIYRERQGTSEMIINNARDLGNKLTF